MTENISTLDFVAFDTETTGLHPGSEALVEVAAVRFNLMQGAKEYFQTLVNPGKPIPWEATQVHGIRDEMVFESPPIHKVLPSFFQFIHGAIPVAHNARFDIGFLALHSLRSEILPPDVPVLDSWMFSRRVCPEQASHKLESLALEFNLGETTFHRALADAKSCMEVFRILVGKSCGVEASWADLLKVHGKASSFLDGSRPLESSSSLHTEMLFNALQNQQSLWISYEGGFSAREVTPRLLYAKGKQQYLEAICHLDGKRKSFRLDRIKKIYRTPEEGPRR